MATIKTQKETQNVLSGRKTEHLPELAVHITIKQEERGRTQHQETENSLIREESNSSFTNRERGMQRSLFLQQTLALNIKSVESKTVKHINTENKSTKEGIETGRDQEHGVASRSNSNKNNRNLHSQQCWKFVK